MPPPACLAALQKIYKRDKKETLEGILQLVFISVHFLFSFFVSIFCFHS